MSCCVLISNFNFLNLYSDHYYVNVLNITKKSFGPFVRYISHYCFECHFCLIGNSFDHCLFKRVGVFSHNCHRCCHQEQMISTVYVSLLEGSVFMSTTALGPHSGILGFLSVVIPTAEENIYIHLISAHPVV